MRRPLVVLALAAFAACIAFAAMADEPVMQPGAMRADRLIGSAVYDTHNQEVGSVKDLVLGPDGHVARVVVLYGAVAGIGGKYVAVDFDGLKFDNERLTLGQTKAQLADLPPYRLDDSEAAPLIIGLGPKAK